MILHYTTLYNTTLHYTIQHYTTLHYTTLYYTIQHYTTLYYTTLYYTIQHYTTLYYTTLHYTTHPDTIHFTNSVWTRSLWVTDLDGCWYTYCTLNTYGWVPVLEAAHHRTILVSQLCKFVLISFMYFRILIQVYLK